ncbi:MULTISPECIES: protein-disulfide reductase DsbD [unclassified Polaromonas]|uniref:protein-disulfide reductase DsbD n=1 Tax=unclassified Polaromonas TaxID=2638319 RepID=UPI000BCA8FCC|nr:MULTISPECIES: protein-disulfide reductase DsbD [unclassified Polaromonas]OYY37509.1 MAG: thiol:disulfide interchange protein [Polaromonas sp. 35-63-35]OYZ20680.1 MAG: thiol:disulfide interchange protein [Polaromonas sp. 16-63-31]OYZ77797.1 MAG: thiol:disulfide interchange protein [Polaromonas sp. 24-63-21]OZA50060.1 MAG: thiol:disulfide interchange protein [Polaromonas sp. 17-63-33]OZA87135.1 MAG: thiol:disulfide interchange protein [Polaromonas sp. 39-63-25]
MLRLLYLIVMVPVLWALPAHAGQEFLPVDQAFRLNVSRDGDGQVRLNWDIGKGYYLYRQQMKVEADPAGGALQVLWPAGTAKTDETYGKSEVYHDQVRVLVEATGARALTVGWQGCADAGLCYPPQTLRVDLADVPATPADLAGPATTRPAPAPSGALGEDQDLAERLSRVHLGWMLAVFFGMGLLMTFTPCVLPMVPILSSLIAGSGASPWRGFVLSLAFVLPMALTYAGVGAMAALAGANLQAVLQNPWMLGTFGLVFVVLALAMFGFYELQLPAVLRNRLNSASQGRRGGTLTGAAAMGVLSALLVGPCMTAPLAGALLYIGNTGDVVTGALALFAMGLGMGVPLLLVGTLGARLLPRPGNWMDRVKALFGFVLLGTAIMFVARILPAALTLGLWGAWLLAIALSLLALGRKLGLGRGRLTSRYLALLLGLWGGAMVIGAAGGAHNPLQPLAFPAKGITSAHAATGNDFMARFQPVKTQQALEVRVAEAGQRGQWTLVDFYADWCVSCQVIERTVFAEPRVQQALDGMQLLRPDVTANNPDDQALMRAHQALGPPTMLLIGPDGRERRAERIIGELDADEFLARLARAKQGG